MSLSYSYYNNSTDDELYKMATKLNNDINNYNKTTYVSYPHYTTQGEYRNNSNIYKKPKSSHKIITTTTTTPTNHLKDCEDCKKMMMQMINKQNKYKKNNQTINHDVFKNAILILLIGIAIILILDVLCY